MKSPRTACCNAPIESYEVNGKFAYGVCRLCELEVLEDGTRSPGWRKTGFEPSMDLRHARQLVDQVFSFYSRLNARRTTTRDRLLTQRDAFELGIAWLRAHPEATPEEIKRQAESFFPFPDFEDYKG